MNNRVGKRKAKHRSTEERGGGGRGGKGGRGSAREREGGKEGERELLSAESPAQHWMLERKVEGEAGRREKEKGMGSKNGRSISKNERKGTRRSDKHWRKGGR
jgi:hypothetical protein